MAGESIPARLAFCRCFWVSEALFGSLADGSSAEVGIVHVDGRDTGAHPAGELAGDARGKLVRWRVTP